MGVRKVTCPGCGASLQAREGESLLRCGYCGASLEQVGAVAPATPPAAAREPARAAPPGADEPSVPWRAIVVGAVVVAALGAIPWALSRGPDEGAERAENAASPTAPPVAEAIRDAPDPAPLVWAKGGPVLVDVNDDGLADVVGWVRSLRDQDAMRLAAFDGRDGAELWTAPVPFSLRGDAWSTVYRQGRTLLADDRLGRVHAFALEDGRETWVSAVGERVVRMCGVDARTVRVVTADRRLVDVRTTTGAVSPAGQTDASQEAAAPRLAGCAPLPSDEATYVDTVEHRHARGRRPPAGVPPIDGVAVEHAVVVRDAGDLYAVGHRTPGAAVPVAAAFRGGAAAIRDGDGAAPDWLTAVPKGAPLESETLAPAMASYAAKTLYVAYAVVRDEGGVRLAALDAETGRVRWDVATPQRRRDAFLTAVVATEERVFVSYVGALYAFDPADGALRWHVGGRSPGDGT